MDLLKFALFGIVLNVHRVLKSYLCIYTYICQTPSLNCFLGHPALLVGLQKYEILPGLQLEPYLSCLNDDLLS